MAFDDARGVVVLFGGVTSASGGELGDTWEWDGAAWTRRPAGGPIARHGHAMAYFPQVGVVLHGGVNDNNGEYYADTWKWDGVAWWGLAPSTGEVAHHRMDYDPSLGLLVAYGGEYWYHPTLQTHGFSPATGWQRIDAGYPSADYGFAYGYHAGIGRIVMFQGSTWELRCALALAPASLPAGNVGNPYAQTLTATGGSPPFQFTQASGALPPGLSLTAAGAIEGTPTTAGSFAFRVDVTNAARCTGSQGYLLDIVTCAAISPATLPDGLLGAAYFQTLTAAGGAPPYTFSLASGALPPGLRLSSGGAISGWPSAPGAYALSIRATDATGCSAIASYALDVVVRFDHLVARGLGPPNAPQVRLHRADGSAAGTDFMAYGTAGWGANVVAGQVDTDALAEVLTGPGPGAVQAPHVRGFRRDGTAMAALSFFAYGTLSYGVNVAAGDLDDDGFQEIVTGAGPGTMFGPHVRGFDFDGGPLSAMTRVSFFAYGTLQYGVNVTAGRVDGDRFAEIVTAPGPGPTFPAHVKGFGVAVGPPQPVAGLSFVAFPTPSYGGLAAAGDVDADGFAEIACAPGPGGTSAHPSRFLGFDYDGSMVALAPGFDVTAFATWYGARPGLGDQDLDGRQELLAGAGRDPAADASVKTYRYDGASLMPGVAFLPFAAAGYGVNVAGGAFGY